MTALDIIAILETALPEIVNDIRDWINASGDEAKQVVIERAAMREGVDAYQKAVDAARSKGT